MPAPAWEFEHSIQGDVSTEFAWNFWTDVGHWALDVTWNPSRLTGHLPPERVVSPRANHPAGWSGELRNLNSEKP